MKDLMLCARVVVRTYKSKMSCRRLAGYVNEMFLNEFCTRNAVIFPGLTNLIIDLRRCRRRFLTSLRDHSLFMPRGGGGGGAGKIHQ